MSINFKIQWGALEVSFGCKLDDQPGPSARPSSLPPRPIVAQGVNVIPLHKATVER